MARLSVLTICILILDVSAVLASPSSTDDGASDTEMREIRLLLQKYGAQIESLQRENVRLEEKIIRLEEQNKPNAKPDSDVLDVPVASAVSDGNIRSSRKYPDDSVKKVNTRVAPSTDSIIAFHAILAHTISDPAKEHIVSFDHVVTNIGAHFSSSTGVFTCAKVGVYQFSWMIKVNGAQYLTSELVRNNAVVGTAMSGDDAYWTTGAASVITMLAPGDEVWIRVASDHLTGADILPTFTMFNGFLIH